MVLLWIIGATFFVSLLAFIGLAMFFLKENILNEILLVLVALSAGALMGGAFLHLIPEAMEVSESVPLFVLSGFISFFLIEKILHWRHCHKEKCEIHAFGYLNLIGDFVHNFIDGSIIAAAFLTNVNLGLVTTLAIIAHEVPQEIGDFGVLLYSGFKKSKALMMNFFVALTAVLGGIFGYFISSEVSGTTPFLLAFAAGGFVYIASSDLIPEIRKEMKMKRWIVSFLVFLLGIAIMYAVKLLGVE